MGFTDKICYEVATKIINTIFLIKYTPTIKKDKTWNENLNNFLVVEWDRLQESDDTESEFTDNEEDMITADAMHILLDFLDVDEDEFEDTELDIDWMRFDDIIGHYTCSV